MLKLVKTSLVGAVLYAATTTAPLAQTYQCPWYDLLCVFTEPTYVDTPYQESDDPYSSSVPEIDARAGALALAGILAMMALAWEIKRRRA